MIYKHKLQFKEAKPFLKKAYTILKEQLGETHPDTLEAKLNLDRVSFWIDGF